MPSLPHRVHAAFVGKRAWLGLAESCTGGLVATRLTDVPGASAYFRGSIVSYGDDAKADLLGVDRGAIEAHGAVSASVARAMAEGARLKLRADVAVSITGSAGPDGDDVGLVFFGVATARGTTTHQVRFPPPRASVREGAAERAMQLALDALP